MKKNTYLVDTVLAFLSPQQQDKNISTHEEIISFVKASSPYTLIPADFFQSILNVFPVHSSIAQGCWVQVGVWKGGSALFLKALMEERDIKQRLYLYDTFSSIPTAELQQPKDIDFVSYLSMQSRTPTNYKADVEHLFKKFELNKNVEFIAQNILQMKQSLVPTNIALLHLDVDFYEPTIAALNLFYDKMLPGGLIIVDDYYMELLNCREAVNDFFDKREIKLDAISIKFSSYSLMIVKP